MSTFTWTPDFGAAQNSEPTVSQVKFGDGYEARVANGINPSLRNWPLSFVKRDVSEIDAIEAFLASAGAVSSFDWTPPRALSSVKVVCRKWSRSFDNAQMDSLSATFEEVAEP